MGEVHAVEGKVKQENGDCVLEAEGACKDIAGTIQKTIGKAEGVVEKP